MARQIVLVLVGCLALVYGAEQVVRADAVADRGAAVEHVVPTDRVAPADRVAPSDDAPTRHAPPPCTSRDELRDAVRTTVRVTLSAVGNAMAIWASATR